MPADRCVSAASVSAAVAPEAAHGPPALAIAARDDRFTPGCVEATATELLLVVRNQGGHLHNLTIPTGESVAVDSGQVALLAVSVGPQGLRYVCTIHPGMEGRIRVAG